MTQWARETAAARAVYGVAAAVAEGCPASTSDVARASRTPREIWERVLALEACGAWLDGARHQSTASREALAPADAVLRATSADALRCAIAAVAQLGEIATVAAASGVPLLALKGAARLLSGEPPGTRTMSDIDLLATPAGARAVHEVLRLRLGYTPDEPGTPTRHLPALTRGRGLAVEIHHELADAGQSALERRIWSNTRTVAVGSGGIAVPDPTALLMHALEHAVVVHRAARFRLRDVIDVSTLASADAVDWAELARYMSAHRDRASMGILLSAARSVPGARFPAAAGVLGEAVSPRHAWRRIRRVGQARLFAPIRAEIAPATDPRVVLLSQLAQGSPREVVRLALQAMATPSRAVRLISGAWLPVEARAMGSERDATPRRHA